MTADHFGNLIQCSYPQLRQFVERIAQLDCRGPNNNRSYDGRSLVPSVNCLHSPIDLAVGVNVIHRHHEFLARHIEIDRPPPRFFARCVTAFRLNRSRRILRAGGVQDPRAHVPRIGPSDLDDLCLIGHAQNHRALLTLPFVFPIVGDGREGVVGVDIDVK